MNKKWVARLVISLAALAVVAAIMWTRYGNSAGPIRNCEMLLQAPDLVVAFKGGKGTAHMVAVARKKGVKVLEVL